MHRQLMLQGPGNSSSITPITLASPTCVGICFSGAFRQCSAHSGSRGVGCAVRGGLNLSEDTAVAKVRVESLSARTTCLRRALLYVRCPLARLAFSKGASDCCQSTNHPQALARGRKLLSISRRTCARIGSFECSIAGSRIQGLT
jgi:hypothetical protein